MPSVTSESPKPTDRPFEERRTLSWAGFEEFMVTKGFSVEPNPSGSAVHFTPADIKERAIIFHKPSPPTLTPDLLDMFGLKLHDVYGWDRDILIEHISARKGMFGDPSMAATVNDEGHRKVKASWFNRLNKKSTDLSRQLLSTTPPGVRMQMSWEDFEKFMKKMGFEMDPTTSGSSVRFDPPNKNDRSITFHKPHPDSNLSHDLITVFGKKLKDYYGWDENMLRDFSREGARRDQGVLI